MPGQATGNGAAGTQAFLVKFAYTPKDQNNHSLVVNASSRDEAKGKVLTRYPRAVFKSVLAI
jgi:hypothetical protein